MNLEQTMLEFYQQFDSKKVGSRIYTVEYQNYTTAAQQKRESISYIPNSSRFRVFSSYGSRGGFQIFDPRVKRKGTDTQYDS